MEQYAQHRPRYSLADRCFIRWVDQTAWPANTKRCCLALFAHQRKHGRVFLKHRTIATWLGISLATVKRALRFLAGRGVLRIEHRVTQLGDWGGNYYTVIPRIATPAADPTPGQTDPTPGGTRTPESQSPQRMAAPAAFAKEKDLLMQKNTTSPIPTNCGDRSTPPATVVVSSASHPSETDWPRLSAAFRARLQTLGPKELVERIVSWALAAPANHPARPKAMEAWIMQGIRARWATPPTWVPRPAAAPAPRVRALSEEEVMARYQPSVAADQPEPVNEPLLAWIRAGSQASQTFLTQVERHLHATMGPLARAAIASEGPAWRAACRRIWEQGEWSDTLAENRADVG